MIFNETYLAGAYYIEIEKLEDERGYFARTWCQREFEDHGLNPRLVQCSISSNKRKGTMRGMHYQKAPFEEAKLIRCTSGALFDVIVDLRPGSVTFQKHLGVTLAADAHNMLYVPEGFGHGFITLTDETIVYYQMSEFYAPEYAKGFRWNDPAFGIEWPMEITVISERDLNYPNFAALA